MKKIRRCYFAVFTLLILFMASSLFAQEEGANPTHPQYNLIGRDAVSEASPLNPNFIRTEESKLTKQGGFWRSSYINQRLIGLAIDDIDKDGKNEVVYAGLKIITVARFEAGQLRDLASYRVLPVERIVSLDVFDVDNDGQMEIIVSTQNDNHEPSAKILKFKEKEIVEVTTNINWYLRVVGSGSNRFLVGQKSSIQNKAKLSGSIFRMTYEDGKMVKGSALSLPSRANVFNFAFAILGKEKTAFTALINFPSEHLMLFEGLNRAWETSEEYGGTLNYIKLNYAGDVKIDKDFIPARILVEDIDGDGENELIVAKNDRGGIMFMKNLRSFNGGLLEAFNYSNMSLNPIFRSRRLPGPAVDYQLKDFNNNGTKDLVVAVVIEAGSGILEEARSVIVAYEISGNSPVASSTK